MKRVFLTLFLVASTIASYNSFAVNNHSAPIASSPMTVSPQMTINDFLKIDFKGYRNADGKKLKWGQRLAMGMAQKNFAKKIKKGKMDGSASLDTALAPGNNNIHGLLSIIFGGAALFVPYFGLALLLAGLVLGIIGIRRDPDPTMAIIGTVICGVVLVLVLLVLVIIASSCWFYC